MTDRSGRRLSARSCVEPAAALRPCDRSGGGHPDPWHSGLCQCTGRAFLAAGNGATITTYIWTTHI